MLIVSVWLFEEFQIWLFGSSNVHCCFTWTWTIKATDVGFFSKNILALIEAFWCFGQFPIFSKLLCNSSWVVTLKVIVARIIIDSFIERQGLLRPGDLILEANGERVGSFLSSEGHFPFWPLPMRVIHGRCAIRSSFSWWLRRGRSSSPSRSSPHSPSLRSTPQTHLSLEYLANVSANVKISHISSYLHRNNQWQIFWINSVDNDF